jgi:REP element-mobilizing transposase RayT
LDDTTHHQPQIDHTMRKARWLAPWKDSHERPVIYHCVTRVVGRGLVFGPGEKEKFRSLMRAYEDFSGCRVLTYCLMSNHVHLLLEVPPMPPGGLSDDQLLARLRAIYLEAEVKEVAKELAKVRQAIAEGRAGEALAREIHERFTYRMHDLGQFMKTLLGRFTRWFNTTHERTGTLWEGRFKSVLVEEGVAARAMAAYIDLNPVRAGMVEDPSDYRWSGYGEAMGGVARARAGLVRALGAHKGWRGEAKGWPGQVSKDYRLLLLAAGVEKTRLEAGPDGGVVETVVRRGMKASLVKAEAAELATSHDVALARVVACRVRYFSDGVAIGGRGFVNGVFEACRERFGAGRKDGARAMRGAAAAARGLLWSMRDLQRRV